MKKQIKRTSGYVHKPSSTSAAQKDKIGIKIRKIYSGTNWGKHSEFVKNGNRVEINSLKGLKRYVENIIETRDLRFTLLIKSVKSSKKKKHGSKKKS